MDDKALQDFLKTVDKSTFTNESYIKRVEKPWGYELIFTPENLPYTGKIMHIEAGKRLSLQIHDTKQESYWLASGKCNLVIENTNGEMETIFMEKGKVYKVTFQPITTSNWFAPGHRIRIEVSSSNFPRFDRNLNTGGKNYDEVEGVVARNVVHHSAQYPSSLTVSVVRRPVP